MPTSNKGTTEFPAHFVLLKWKGKNVCLSTVGKKFQLIEVNKQALFWKWKEWIEFREAWIKIFEHLLTYLGLSINGLLEMWLGLLTFYFRCPKSSQKIFLGSSRDIMQILHLRVSLHCTCTFPFKLRELKKRSKHFSFSEHFISTHNLFSWLFINIVRNWSLLLTLGTFKG